VSNEPSGLIEKHIEAKGIAYPIAKLKGEDADRIYGIKGFPSGYLVDPSGRVIWQGHPGNLSASEIEKALESAAFVAPLAGDDLKKLNKLIAEQDFGTALGEIDKGLAANGDDATLKGAQEAIEGLLKRKLEAAAKAIEEQDFGVALMTYEEVDRLFAGHMASKDAKDKAKELEKNPEAKNELAAWKKMVKGDQAQLAGDFEKAGKVYAGIVKKYEGTKCAARAQEFLGRHPG
jgi:hypothetical protein